MSDLFQFPEERSLRFGSQDILPGMKARPGFKVGALPSGVEVAIQLEVIRSEKPGPHVLIVGGVHGDEINGIELVRKMLDDQCFNDLLCGSVIAIPLLNVFGFLNFSRDVPFGKDVNRSFPGVPSGSLASRVAGIMTRHILPQIDIVIDCHTGAHNRYNYPQIRVSKEDEQALILARAFNPPYILQKGQLRGSLRKTAVQAGKSCLIYEAGEALRMDGFSISKGMKGITRVLEFLGMIHGTPAAPHPTIEIPHASWIRANASGLFLCRKYAGNPIVKGEPLGEIADPYGAKRHAVYATRDGHIIGHNNAPVVYQGDALFHIGYH